MASSPTNATLLAALQALTITGVTLHLDEPPAQIKTADLPVAFPLLPGSQLLPPAVSCLDNNKRRSGGIVIIWQAGGQGTIPQNFADVAEHMDNLESAIDGLIGDVGNFIDYQITTTGAYLVGGNAYWAVVARITVRSR